MKSIPKWMQDLTINTLIEFKPGCDIPIITIRHRADKFSSGRCDASHIALTIGTSRKDAKLILLHELAHWILPRVKKFYGWGIWRKEFTNPQGHTPEFWDLAWTLYRWAKLPVSYCKSREYSYRAGAKQGYLRSRKKES